MKRALRYVYLRFVRLRATPSEISLGFACGVFWGMFPLPGLQMATAIVTAAILRGNKLAAAAGTWLTNPITTLPFTAMNFYVGQAVLGREWQELPKVNFQSLPELIDLGSDFFTSYLMGCLVTGAIGGMISYVVGIPLIAWVQRRTASHRERRVKRKSDRVRS